MFEVVGIGERRIDVEGFATDEIRNVLIGLVGRGGVVGRGFGRGARHGNEWPGVQWPQRGGDVMGSASFQGVGINPEEGMRGDEQNEQHTSENGTRVHCGS